jgi:hypothetical protein
MIYSGGVQFLITRKYDWGVHSAGFPKKKGLRSILEHYSAQARKRQEWSILEVSFNYCWALICIIKKERKHIYCGVVFNSSLNSLQLKTLFWSIPELWSCWCCPQFWYFLEFDYVSKVISIYLKYAI